MINCLNRVLDLVEGKGVMPKVKNKPIIKKHRIQIDVSPSQLVSYDRLMHFCDLNTKKDLLDNAMTLFDWAVEEARKGRRIASYDEKLDDVEKIRFPVLEAALKHAQQQKLVSDPNLTVVQDDAQTMLEPSSSSRLETA